MPSSQISPTVTAGLLLFTALGWSQIATYAEDAETAKLTVQSIDGKLTGGVLDEFNSTQLTIGGQAPWELKVEDLVRLDSGTRSAAELGGQNLILLANGDRLVADVLSSGDGVFVARWSHFPGLGDFSIPLEMVRGIAWQLPQDRVTRARMLADMQDYSQKTDRLILRNGNSLTGEFFKFDSEKLSWQSTVGERDIENKTLQSLTFNPDLIDFPEPKGLRLIVTSVDGSRFTAEKFELKADAGMEFTTAFGATLVLATDRIVSLQVVGGRAVYLSDLTPQQYTFTPYSSLDWPLRTDRSVSGDALRLGGREYAKGLGTHSRCEITYALNGEYSRFYATVGIDSAAGSDGNAVVEIQVDEKPVFKSEPLAGALPAVTINPIDTTGAKKLTLIVHYGERADVWDHVDWCDALLVK